MFMKGFDKDKIKDTCAPSTDGALLMLIGHQHIIERIGKQLMHFGDGVP